MYKQIVAIVLSVCIIVALYPTELMAENVEKQVTLEEESNLETDGASVSAANSVRTVDDVISQYKFRGASGHGFAAEQGNNQIDRIKGNNAKVIGDNNVKNGADRQILNRDGSVINIQDKYYSTASDTIAACFDETGFRYIDADGNLMQIEVPADQYEDAINLMKKRISAGEVQGVTDPDEATSIVRKGNLTYAQAKNLAKAGTFESLKYDAVNGAVAATWGMGISAALNYAICILNGEDAEEALKSAAVEGVKTGAGVFCTSVIAGQLSKTEVINIFAPSSEALTKSLGEDFSKTLLKAFGQDVLQESGAPAAESATKQAAKLLRSEVLVSVVATVVFSVPDAIDVFQGRISQKQFVKNFAVTATSITAGAVGYGVGGAISNLIVPGVGTVPGAIVGSVLFGLGGGAIADKIADYIADDDADEMYEILESQFAQLCEDYMVNEKEAQEIADLLQESLDSDLFKEMYQSKDREEFCNALLVPLFDDMTENRATVAAPSEEEMRQALKEELKGVVFVH